MYIIKNAIKNLERNKGRNLLLGMIILGIVVTTVVSLAITHTSQRLTRHHQEQFGSRVVIAPDMDAIFEKLQETLNQRDEVTDGLTAIPTPRLTAEQSLAFTRSPYVSEYQILAIHGANHENLLAVDEEAGSSGIMLNPEPSKTLEEPPTTFMDQIVMPYFRLIGGHFLDDFMEGLRQLIEGDMPANFGEVLISTEIAQLNQLSVGDEISLYSNLFNGEEIKKVSRDLLITGIYLDMTENQMFFPSPYLNRRNELLTTLETVTTFLTEGEMQITIDATYYLHDPSYLAAFESEMRRAGMDPLLVVSTDEVSYHRLVGPILGLAQAASTFLGAVLSLGGLVLVILSFIAIRERRYEIGVLRSIGLKKRKLIFGLWFENFTLTIFCLIIGLMIGRAIAQPVSDQLLAAQVANMTPVEVETGFLFGINQLNRKENTQSINELQVALNKETVGQIIGISLALTTFSTLIAATQMTKFEPFKILTERG